MVILAHGLRIFSSLWWEDCAWGCGILRQWLTQCGSKPEAEKTDQTFEGPFIVTRQASVLKGLPAPQAVSPTASWRHFWWNHSAFLLPLTAAIAFSLRSICTGSQNVVWVQFLKFLDFLNDTYGNEENLSASILSYPQIGKFRSVHIGSGRPKTPFPQIGMLISE